MTDRGRRNVFYFFCTIMDDGIGNSLSFRLEVCLAVEVHVGGQLRGGFGGVVREGEAMGVRDGPEAGLPEVGSLGDDHRLKSGPVAMGLKAERLNLNTPERRDFQAIRRYKSSTRIITK